MAVAIPFVASALGAGAVATTAISIGFAVTGISAKIDKAASKVFGEDMVKFANIAGAAFAVYNGGFSLDSAGDAVAGTAGATADAAADAAFNADWAAATTGDGGLMAGEALAGATDGFNLSQLAADNTDEAFNADFADMQAGKETISEVKGVDLTTGKGTGVDSKLAAQAAKAPSAPEAPTVKPAAATTAGVSTPAGATSQQAAGTSATSDIKAAWDKGTDTVGNVFKKVFADEKGVIDKKLVGASLQAVGGAYQGAAANRLKREQLAEEQRRYAAVPKYRLT